MRPAPSIRDHDPFRGVLVFVAIAEESSVRRAAVRLGVSPAAVSKALLALEAELGVTLFVRGPRAVTLTREGETFLAHCRPALSAVESGRAALESGKRQPQGEVVITAPFVAAEVVARALALLRDRHPRLSFSLRITDRMTRLGEERVDVAVRIGALEDSSLVARKLGGTRLVTVASPAYLARAGVPRTPAELDAHACIAALGPRGKPHAWRFAGGASREVRALVIADHGPSVLFAAMSGVGIAQVFDFMAEPHLASGALARVLDPETAAGPDVFAVCAPGRTASPRVRATIDALRESFARPPVETR